MLISALSNYNFTHIHQAGFTGVNTIFCSFNTNVNWYLLWSVFAEFLIKRIGHTVHVVCWWWQQDITEALFLNCQQIIQARSNAGNGLDGEKSSSVHPYWEESWTVAHNVDTFMEWYSPSVKGGVANGKHFRLVMTRQLFSENEPSLFAPLQVFDSSFDFS